MAARKKQRSRSGPGLLEMERSPEAWLEKYVNRQLLSRSYDLICDEPIDNVLVFPAFTPVFCADLVKMIEAKPAADWLMDKGSPYAINEMWLVTLGLDDIYRRVMRDHIRSEERRVGKECR